MHDHLIRDAQNRRLIETLLHKRLRLWSNYGKFHRELIASKIDLDFMVFKNELSCVLRYLGKTSLDVKTRLRQYIEGNLLYCIVKEVFRCRCRLNMIFRIIHRYLYSNCRVAYYGKLSIIFTPERLNNRQLQRFR